MPKPDANRLSSWFLPLLCVILAAGLIYVSLENLRLKKDLSAALEHRHIERAMMTDRSGEVAPPFAALMPDGREITIRTDALSAPIVLAWLKEDCEACVETIDAWNRLADRYPSQVWGVSRLASQESGADSPWSDAGFMIVTPVSDAVYSQYDIGVTPQTMLVLQDGTIGDVRYGPLSQKDLEDLERRLQPPLDKGGDGE